MIEIALCLAIYVLNDGAPYPRIVGWICLCFGGFFFGVCLGHGFVLHSSGCTFSILTKSVVGEVFFFFSSHLLSSHYSRPPSLPVVTRMSGVT